MKRLQKTVTLLLLSSLLLMNGLIAGQLFCDCCDSHARVEAPAQEPAGCCSAKEQPRHATPQKNDTGHCTMGVMHDEGDMNVHDCQMTCLQDNRQTTAVIAPSVVHSLFNLSQPFHSLKISEPFSSYHAFIAVHPPPLVQVPIFLINSAFLI